MKNKHEKVSKNKREKLIAFIYVSLFFLLTTGICTASLLYYSSVNDTKSQKDFAISKMDRIRSYQARQNKEMIIIDSLYNQIGSFNPGINATYEENDIKFYLNSLKDVYNKNSFDERYKIFLQTSNFYNMWFDDKKELWSKQSNIISFRKNLEACEIGLERKISDLKNSK